MITDALELWNRVETKLGKRGSALPRIELAEKKEWIDDMQLEMASQVPLKMAGDLRITRSLTETLIASGYPDTFQFTLPVDCIGEVNVSIDLGLGVKKCQMKDFEKHGYWLWSTNRFGKPKASKPWALRKGRAILISPSTAGMYPVVLDMIRIPAQCTDDLANPILLLPELRELLVLKVAAQAFTDKLGAPAEGQMKEAEFAAKWQQLTGVPWKVLKQDEYKPPLEGTAQ